MSTAALSVAAGTRAGSEQIRAGERSARNRNNRIGWAFVAPFVIVFAMFLIWPLIHGFYLSFTGESITGANGELIGFANYAEALARPDHVALAAQHPVVHGAVDDPARHRRARPRAARAPGAARPVAVAALVLHAVPAGVDRRRAVLDLDVQPAARARELPARASSGSIRWRGCRIRRGRCSPSSS